MEAKKALFDEDKKIVALSVILACLAFAYLSKGFYNLVISDIGAKDLLSRWQEQQYIYHYIWQNITQNPLPEQPETGFVFSIYPPWAWIIGLIIFPPIPFEILRVYHALLNLNALVILGLFAYELGYRYGKLKAWFSVLVCLSISSHGTTLGVGQYGIIINAFLIEALWLLERHQDLLAGIYLGLALTKPNISAFFIFIPFVRKKFRVIFAFTSYLILLNYLVLLLTSLNPFEILISQFKLVKEFSKDGYSGIDILIDFGIEPTVAIILLILVGIGLSVASFIVFKKSSWLLLFATAAVLGRVSMYHRIYDNVMLVFLLLACLKITLQKSHQGNILMFSLVLFSLLIPAKATDLAYIQTTQFIIWISSLLYLLTQDQPRK